MSKEIILYSAQTENVRKIIKTNNVCYSKRFYVEKKYCESAKVFLHNYDWFVSKMQNIVKKPDEAEYIYWGFKNLYNVEDAKIIKPLMLKVPFDECVLFDMNDWAKIMRFDYIGENDAEEKKFNDELKKMGLNNYDIIMSDFYKDEKKEIINSWDKLFKYDKRLKNGENISDINIQAAFWCIKKEWVINNEVMD